MTRTADSDLVARMVALAHHPATATEMGDVSGDVALPPLTPAVIDRVETELGFPLPRLLRQLYLQVGNGGFGPAYGLMALTGVPNPAYEVLGQFRSTRSVVPTWPSRLLPICHQGSGTLFCLDATVPDDPPVVRYAPGLDEQETREMMGPGPVIGPGLVLEHPSFRAWLMAWVDRTEARVRSA
jgi:hypothetical protein